jgi:hypothetical protein
VRALLLVALLPLVLPDRAHAYEEQLTLDLAGGWGIAPGLQLPDNGPAWTLGTSIGFDDTWGLSIYAGWATHPAFNEGSPLHLGVFGVEGLYYIDVLQVVPFFGVGVDVIPTFDEATNAWGADFAAHLRLSVDYLATREIAVGVDVRPYILFTRLSLEPVYLTFLLRVSVILDY